MFKFIISMLVMFIAVPAMAQMQTQELEGMQFFVPSGWEKGIVLGATSWSEKTSPSRFTASINWQALPIKDNEVITAENITEDLSILNVKDLSISKSAEQDFDITYTVEISSKTILFKQRCLRHKKLMFIGTLTFLENRSEEFLPLWEKLQKVTPVVAKVKPVTQEEIEVEIEDIRDLIDVKETKLNRIRSLNNSEETCEALTTELEELGLQLRKLERQAARMQAKNSVLETLKRKSGFLD